MVSRTSDHGKVFLKEHVSMPASPEAKESPGFFDLMAFLRSPKIVCTVVQRLTVECKSKSPTSSISDEFEDECEATCTVDCSQTKLRREDFPQFFLIRLFPLVKIQVFQIVFLIFSLFLLLVKLMM